MTARANGVALLFFVLAACSSSPPRSHAAPEEDPTARPTATPVASASATSSSWVRPASAPSASASARAGAPALPCCRDLDELAKLDGRRVAMVGTYIPERVAKELPSVYQSRRDPDAETVRLEVDEKVSVMLGIYYGPSGRRPPAERRRFAGERVRVVGTVHAHTPSRKETDGKVFETMIGPYIDVETIDRAASP